MKLVSALNLLILGLSSAMCGQVVPPSVASAVPQHVATEGQQVPLVIRFSGHIHDLNDKPIVGLNGVTFALYKEETGGAPLWLEVQNVTLDGQGRFTVLLGSSNPQGIPTDLFSSREARWLGMSTDSGFERPRVLLVSVPYALEAANAETLGGRRPEEFLSANQVQGLAQTQYLQRPCLRASDGSALACDPRSFGSPAIAPTFEATSLLGPSFLSDATTGPPLAVQSSEMVSKLNVDLLHGLSASDFAQTKLSNQFSRLQLFNEGISLEGTPPTGTTGQASPPLDLKARFFDSATQTFQDRRFRWQSKPADNTNAQPDRLSLLFGAGRKLPTETGFSINSDGTITFASNQQLPTSAVLAALNTVNSVPVTGVQTDYSTAYQWQQTQSSSALVAGLDTITLAHCPPGVVAGDPSLYVYISGTGTPEAVQVTGGTCQGDGKPGTLQFVAASAHPAGYSVSSASSGLEESLIAAAHSPTQSGSIVVPPGEYAAYAQITIRVSNVTIDFSGSTIDCYMSASCIFLGDPKNPSAWVNIALKNPRGKPMVPYGTYPFIEDNAQTTRLENVTANAPTPPNNFGSYVQVDNDQSFTLDGLNSSPGYAVRCDANFCGSYVTAPGPFSKWAAVGWLQNLNLSLQCHGSGVDWQSGNGLQISNSVIQGWSLFGVRVGQKFGGYGGFISNNVYYEASSSCMPYNPLGNVGLAGVINQGGEVSIKGYAMNGLSGAFPNWGASSGSSTWNYWVVPVHPTYGDGVPLPAGYALTNGPVTIAGTYPRIAGASSYRILKMVWSGTGTPPYPEGTGNYLLTTVQQASCGKQTCQFTDNGQSLTSYSNAGENFNGPNMYLPLLDFWPGSLIMSQSTDTTSAAGSILSPMLTADILSQGTVVNTLPANMIVGQAQTSIPSAVIVPSAGIISAMNTGASILPAATILKAFNSAFALSSGFKGRLNFGDQGMANGFSAIITVADSNWGRTWASGIQRPTADVGDLDIGYEGAISTYYQRASSEIRNYIGKFPDGKPQESLTTTAKTFNVPVVINGNLIVMGTCTGCGQLAGQAAIEGQATPPAIGEESTSSLARSGNVRATVPTPSGGASRVGQTSGIAPTLLCATSTCGVGPYTVHYYLNSTSSCPSSESATVSLTLTWADESSTKSLQVPLSGNRILDGSRLSLGSTSNFGSGAISMWTAGSVPIEYSTSYTPCTSGEGTYSLRVVLSPVQ
jgi:hypothetical protein